MDAKNKKSNLTNSIETTDLTRTIRSSKKDKSLDRSSKNVDLKASKDGQEINESEGFTLLYSQVLDSEYVQLPTDETRKFVEGTLASLDDKSSVVERVSLLRDTVAKLEE